MTPASVSADRKASSTGSAWAGEAATAAAVSSPADSARAVVSCDAPGDRTWVERQEPDQAPSMLSATSMILAFCEAGLSISPAT